MNERKEKIRKRNKKERELKGRKKEGENDKMKK